MKEEWIIIKEYPEYMISNFGNVKSLKRKKSIILSPDRTKNGYLQVKLYKYGYSERIKIHRLVYENFKKCICKSKQINHIDGNKNNNFIENLEETSASENIKHAYIIGLKKPSNISKNIGTKNPNSKLNKNDIVNIRRHLKNNLSLSKIAKLFNVTKYTISDIKRNKTWMHIEEEKC